MSDAMEMTWLQQGGPARFRAAREIAEQLRLALTSGTVEASLSTIAPIGGTSHQVDAIVRPHAESLGFSSQRTTLFSGYPVGLRPDWYRKLGRSGILLEVERGKAVANNMDLLDLWKCHICHEAEHLILIVPILVTRSYGIENVHSRVATRLATFFVPGNETNVRSVAVLGYS
jgi:hypothetical protein